MPKAISTLRNVHRSHIAATNTSKGGHIWISDDLLSHTFNQFARTHVRHGSNVPGPLEARRRSAKRKLSLVHHASPADAFDPAVLFGTQPSASWWQQPEQVDAQAQHASWPWPLTASLFAEKPSTPSPVLTEDTTDEVRLKKTAQNARRRLQNCLDKSETYEAFANVLDELKVDLVHEPSKAQWIFRHLLTKQWHAEDVAKFLLDPRLNPAGSSNLAYFFRRWQKHELLCEELLERDVVPCAVRLGLLTVEDIRRLVVRSNTISFRTAQSKFDWSRFCIQIIDAIEDSRVLRLADLHKPFLSRWLRLIKSRGFEPCTPRLLDRLHQLFEPCNEARFGTVVREALTTLTRPSIHDMSHLVDYILERPHSLVSKTLLETTSTLAAKECTRLVATSELETTTYQIQHEELMFRRALVARNWVWQADKSLTYFDPVFSNLEPSLDREPTLFECWYAVLAGIGAAHRNRFVLHKSAFEAWIATGQADDGQRLLVGFWTIMALSLRKGTPLAQIKQLDLGRCIENTLSEEAERRREDILATFLRLLHSSGLPVRNQFLQRVSAISGAYLNVNSSYWDLQEYRTALSTQRIDRLREESCYRSIRHHFPKMLNVLGESMNEDLSRFEKICCAMLRETRGSSNLVLRLLFHNRELTFALARAASFMAEENQDSRPGSKVTPNHIAIGNHTYLELIEMMERIIWAAATSQQYSDRIAVAKVYWLYMYMQMHNAPLTPSMHRALWHVVVIRPRSSTYTMLRRVHGLIADAEGHEAAQNLLEEHGSYRIDAYGAREVLEAKGDIVPRKKPNTNDAAPMFTGSQLRAIFDKARLARWRPVVTDSVPLRTIETDVPPEVEAALRRRRSANNRDSTASQAQRAKVNAM